MGYVPGVTEGIIKQGNLVIRDRSMAKRLHALRETYEWIDRNTPRDSMIQPNPASLDIAYGIYSNRASLAADQFCGAAFGGSAAACANLLQSLFPLFENGGVGPPQGPDYICQRFPLKMIIVKDTDPVWRNKSSWVWQSTPVHANAFSRVFACPAPKLPAGL